jgi:predicted RNA-binding Zn-ribbon protein involved in translation (DUF1610 family)
MKMQFEMTMKPCPLCGGTERYRMARSRKWKLLFFVRSYSCRACHSQYVRFFGLFSLLVEQGFKPFYSPNSESGSVIGPDYTAAVLHKTPALNAGKNHTEIKKNAHKTQTQSP